MTLRHWLAHLFGVNGCRVKSWYEANGDHCVGAECVTCGAVHAKTIVNFGELARLEVCACGEVFRDNGPHEEVERRHAEWLDSHVCAGKHEGSKTFWLSFCDGDKPKGQQFLGACLVDVSAAEADDATLMIALRFPLAEEGAEWIGAASRKAHALGCNPGGDMASYEVPAGHPMLQFYARGVLMDRATITRIDDEIAAAETKH